jgi:hypothetical protein
MTTETSIEVARDDGVYFRSVHLAISATGAIVLDACDRGPLVRQTFDKEDYEFGVTVTPGALARLAFELLKDKFAGDIGAVDAFRAYCEARGVPHKFGTW